MSHGGPVFQIEVKERQLQEEHKKHNRIQLQQALRYHSQQEAKKNMGKKPIAGSVSGGCSYKDTVYISKGNK